jgi:hypothetical protein
MPDPTPQQHLEILLDHSLSGEKGNPSANLAGLL